MSPRGLPHTAPPTGRKPRLATPPTMPDPRGPGRQPTEAPRRPRPPCTPADEPPKGEQATPRNTQPPPPKHKRTHTYPPSTPAGKPPGTRHWRASPQPRILRRGQALPGTHHQRGNSAWSTALINLPFPPLLLAARRGPPPHPPTSIRAGRGGGRRAAAGRATHRLAKPPMGTLLVPVTNCSSRARISCQRPHSVRPR